jgi:ABC-type Fe3+/spermidine/putrescine transport system ATPase subunit
MKRVRLARFTPAIRGAPPCAPVDLELAPGETVALLGPSGAGKSSLLRAIAGLVPSTGDIVIGDRAVGRLPPEGRRAVYLHQSPRLFPHLDVAGNIGFPMRLRGLEDAEVRKTTAMLLAQVQLHDAGARNVTSLSGGEQQRVALARAIAAAPELLLLDEPFAALDPALRAEVRDAIVALLGDSPPTTLVVTHDPEEAAAMATRIAVMLAGRLVQLATPRALFDSPATISVATFLGVENLWSLSAASVVADGTLAPPSHSAQVSLPASALVATPSETDPHRVVAVRETRSGQRVEGVTHGVSWVARARGSVVAGGAVALEVDASRLRYYDASGSLMGA